MMIGSESCSPASASPSVRNGSQFLCLKQRFLRFRVSAMRWLGKFRQTVEAVADEDSALTQLRCAVVHGVYLEAVEPVRIVQILDEKPDNRAGFLVFLERRSAFVGAIFDRAMAEGG